MNAEMIDYKEMMRDVKRAMEDEQDRLTAKIERLNGMMKMAEMLDELLSKVEELEEENNSLKQDNENLQQTNDRQQEEIEKLRADNKEKDMKIAELTKLATGVAKKSSQDDLVKALHTYAKRSKRKTVDKRIFAKSAILEIANANDLTLPEDLRATIESLDDELTEPKLTIQAQGDVKVEGDYNDIHDNKAVNF